MFDRIKKHAPALVVLAPLLLVLCAASVGTRQLLLDATNKPTSTVSLSSSNWVDTLDITRLPVGTISGTLAGGGDSRIVRAGRNEPGIYVPAGWGKNLFTKLAAAQAGIAKLSCAIDGDSITQGLFASRLNYTSYAAIVGMGLRGPNGGAGDGGSGFVSCGDTPTALLAAGVSSAAISAYQANGDLVDQSGTWSADRRFYDGPGFSVLKTNAVGSSLTFPVRGTAIRVFYFQQPTNCAFTVAVDGGAPVTVTVNASNNGPGVYSVAAPAGAHSVVVTASAISSGNYVYICGASAENSTGVVVHKYALGGMPSYALTNVPGQTTPNGLTGSGYANTLMPGGWWSGGSQNPADLVIYAMGVNDAALYSTDPETEIQNVQLFLDDLRQGGAQNGGTDIVLVLPHVGSYNSALYARFAARMRVLAETYGCPLIDFWTQGRNSYANWSSLGYWGNGNNPGIPGTDPVHPGDAGHSFMAQTVLSVVLPYPYTMANFVGDSITLGYGTTTYGQLPPTARWSYQLCQALGWGEYNVAVTNLQATDQADQVRPLVITPNSVSVCLTGYNDARFFNANAAQMDDYRAALSSNLAFMALPAELRHSSSEAAYSGAWNVNPIWGTGVRVTTNAGATATFHTMGSAILIGTARGAASAPELISVDGSPAVPVTVTQQVATFSGRAYGPALYSVSGLSPGAHTVTVTSQGNAYLDWFAGLDGSALGPRVYVGGCLAMGVYDHGNSPAIVAQTGGIAAAVCAQLQGIGMRVYYTAPPPLDPASDYFSDNIHPNNAGDAKIETAFLNLVNAHP